MPKGFGRLEHKLMETHPRVRSVWENYHHTIKIIGGFLFLATIISAVAWLGLNTQTASDRADEAQRAVRVVTNSPCQRAKKHPGNEQFLKECRATFTGAVKLIGPKVSCEIIESGATWLVIDGQRIEGIECIPPPSQRRKKSSSPRSESKESSSSASEQGGSAGNATAGGNNGSSQTGSQGGSEGSGPRNQGVGRGDNSGPGQKPVKTSPAAGGSPTSAGSGDGSPGASPSSPPAGPQSQGKGPVGGIVDQACQHVPDPFQSPACSVGSKATGSVDGVLPGQAQQP